MKMIIVEDSQGFPKEEFKRTIAIDFDHTIAEVDKDYNILGLKPGAKEALEKLKEKYEIAIFTGRNSPTVENSEEKLNEVEVFLDNEGVYYDRIARAEEGKIPAEYYIDDRAVEFKDNWDEIVKRVFGK